MYSTTIAHWHFVSKLEDTSICRRWIHVSQQNGLLLPGESVNITLTVRVDKKTAQALHLGRELLEDVLILRIENSGDGVSLSLVLYFFLPLSQSMSVMIHSLLSLSVARHRPLKPVIIFLDINMFTNMTHFYLVR